MRRPGFWQGALVAMLLALSGALIAAAVLPFAGVADTARLVVPLLTFVYLAYLLPRSGVRAGRITVLVAWGAISIAAWFFVSSFAAYLLIHVAMLWLLRSLYFYSGVLPALMDLGLAGAGSLFALGTLYETGSTLLAVWVFFLIQALFTAIPRSMRSRSKGEPAPSNDNFNRARRQAEAALQQLMAP